jgi:hypothetical protein
MGTSFVANLALRYAYFAVQQAADQRTECDWHRPMTTTYKCNLQNHEIALTGRCTICHHFNFLFYIQIAHEGSTTRETNTKDKTGGKLYSYMVFTKTFKTLEAKRKKKKKKEKKSPLVLYGLRTMNKTRAR